MTHRDRPQIDAVEQPAQVGNDDVLARVEAEQAYLDAVLLLAAGAAVVGVAAALGTAHVQLRRAGHVGWRAALHQLGAHEAVAVEPAHAHPRRA